MDPIQCARAYFARGCNCSQAVLAALGPQYGLDPEQCMKIAAALGGGIARQGDTCGAVTGALMLLGLKYAGSPLGDPTAKEEIYQQAEAYLQAFVARHGSVTCRALLGYDMSTPEGRQMVRDLHLAKTHCPQFVESAVTLFLQFEHEDAVHAAQPGVGGKLDNSAVACYSTNS